jgi:shikimate 5-dehydrogenase
MIMYFIGVTTAASSIHKHFPIWTAEMGITNARLQGIDCVPNDQPARYREIVQTIKSDPNIKGALVTTHKLNLFTASHDLFDQITPLARSMAEISSIFKRDGKLCGDTSDPQAGGAALEQVWPDSNAEVCILGAGGASVALSWYLLTKRQPAKITITDISADKLTHIKNFHQTLGTNLPPVHYQTGNNDDAVSSLPPGSLVINATGLGKDAPGSPLTAAATFPDNGVAWELNYRGNLIFLDQARAQPQLAKVVDGLDYFENGWKHVIRDVFPSTVASASRASR